MQSEFTESEVRRICEDAMTAINYLQAIVTECESDYQSRRYIAEKMNKAARCVSYIESVVGVVL